MIDLPHVKTNVKYHIEAQYYHPTNQKENFIKTLNNSIQNINKNKHTFYLLENLNINLTPKLANLSAIFIINMLHSNCTFLLIMIPTKVNDESRTIYTYTLQISLYIKTSTKINKTKTLPYRLQYEIKILTI